MHSSKFFRRLTAGAVALAVSGAAVVVTSVVANAQQAGDGTLTLLPATGTQESVLTGDTSGPCVADTTNSYNIQVDGPGDFDGTITGNQDAGISFTDPFQVRFALSFGNFARVVGLPIVPGRYDIALRCVNTFNQEARRFTGVLNFSSPTAYTAQDSTPPSPTVTATTTDLTVFPSPAFQGLPVFMFAQVAPNNAAGTVQFKDGNTNIGGPVQVNRGVAFRVAFGLAVGEHTIIAEFTPADPARFGTSSDSERLTVRRLSG